MEITSEPSLPHQPQQNLPIIEVTNSDVLVAQKIYPSFPVSTQPHFTPSTDLTKVIAVGSYNKIDTQEMIRQIEYYFSDQNLPNDRHLLMMTGGDGTGPASLSEICSFKKMRRFRPTSVVAEALRQSAVIVIMQQGKRIKRRFPLMIKPSVEPETDRQRERIEQALVANPHLTKNMLKPTGFEEYYADPPVTPQEYEKNRDRYDPETSFMTRIENGIVHYRSKRKMHQNTLRVFDKWMDFGGIATGQHMFTSGCDSEEDLEGLDKEDIAAMKLHYTVDKLVLKEEHLWSVDFEGIAKAWLSTEFTTWFYWENPIEVKNVCNVMRNFYSFLLHHDVCPEYADQIHAARKIVSQAEIELPMLAAFGENMLRPNTFSAACSTVHGGYHATLSAPKGDWAMPEDGDQVGTSPEDARTILLAGIAAFGTPEQLSRAQDRTLEAATKGQGITSFSGFKIVDEDELGLEVAAIDTAPEESYEFFSHLDGTIVPKMGILKCRRWKNPAGPLEDLRKDIPPPPENFEFIVEQGTLAGCVVGMKFEATIMKLDIDLWYIDFIETTYPSFHLWVPNRIVKDWKEHTPHKEYIKQMGLEGKSTEQLEFADDGLTLKGF